MNTDKKEWQEFSHIIKDVLKLELLPVAVTRTETPVVSGEQKKIRICKAILDAAQGNVLQVSKANNVCFGAAWHLGFHKLDDPKVKDMVRKFVVEGEKLFTDYQALDTLMSQMNPPGDNSKSYFVLSSMDKAVLQPEVVIFVCNPAEACNILTLVTFPDGKMPQIKIGGPTCRMAVMYPMTEGEVNLSFYDSTARRMCNTPKDKLLITLPYQKIAPLVHSLDRCSAGTAKIEYPQEFREFLQKRLAR